VWFGVADLEGGGEGDQKVSLDREVWGNIGIAQINWMW